MGDPRVRIEGFSDVSEVLEQGIYALVAAGKIVYIGKAKVMLARVYTHRSNARKRSPVWLSDLAKGIVFDEVHVMPAHPDQIDELEHALINFYKPRYNIALKHLGCSTKVALTVTSPGGVSITLGGRRAPAPAFERRL
jgi:excinuclease UvrABC nuclease subunit